MNLRRVLILTLIAGVLSFLLIAYAELVRVRSDLPWLLDYAKFHLSAQALNEGEDIYRSLPLYRLGQLPAGVEVSDPNLHPNLNLPFVTILFWPFTMTDIATGMAIWATLSIGFAMASAWLMGNELLRGSNLPGFFHWVVPGLLATSLLIFYPSWASISLGQLGQLLLLILCGAWLAARRQNDRLAGTLFGLALALKPFTGIFLLVLPWLRRWRLMRWYIGCFGLLTFLGAAVVGPESYLRYWQVLQEVDWYGFGWNASLMAPLSVVLGGNAPSEWLHHPWLAKSISIVFSMLLYFLLIRQLRYLVDPVVRLDIAVAGSIPLMLLASPLGWLYYFLGIWVSGIAVVIAVRPLESRKVWWLLAIGMLILCGLPYPFVNARDIGQSWEFLLVNSIDTAALLVAFAFVIGAARHLRNQQFKFGIHVPADDTVAGKTDVTLDKNIA